MNSPHSKKSFCGFNNKFDNGNGFKIKDYSSESLYDSIETAKDICFKDKKITV